MSWEEEDLKSGGRGNVEGVVGQRDVQPLRYYIQLVAIACEPLSRVWFKFCCFPQTCQRSVLHADVLVLVNRLTRCSEALQLMPRRAAGRFLPSKQSSEMHDRNACSYYNVPTLNQYIIQRKFKRRFYFEIFNAN